MRSSSISLLLLKLLVLVRYQTSKLVVSNHGKHFLRKLSDPVTNSSITLEAYTSAHLSPKMMILVLPTEVKWMNRGQFTTNQTKKFL
jgi:hypothetical protein